MAKYLDDTGLKKYTELVKGEIEKKQDVLKGTGEQVVGFDAQGKAVAREAVLSVNDKSGEVEIGGVNLYTGTKDWSGDDWQNMGPWRKTGDKFQGLSVLRGTARYNGYRQTIHAKAGETYTFSIYARVDEPHTTQFYANYLSDDSGKVSPYSARVNVSSEWARYSFTFTIIEDVTIGPRLENVDEGYLYVCGAMLERGNVATDWDTSPFDGITNDEIHGGTQILRGTENVIIGSGTWESGTWRHADKSITVMEGTVHAPNAGIIRGFTLINESADIGGYTQTNIPINVGYPYVLSCYVKGKGDLVMITGNNPYVRHVISVNSTNWKRAYWCFIPGAENEVTGNETNVYFEAQNTSAEGIEICGEKLEVGVVPTDWSPAPEDLAIKGDVDKAISDINNELESTDDRLQALEDADNNWLPKAGGTMTGDLDMGAHFVKSTGVPSVESDLTNKKYVDGEIETVTEMAATATRTAMAAQTAADNAQNDATSAYNMAETAEQAAQSAQTAADEAGEQARLARGEAQAAQETADEAKRIAEQASGAVGALVALTDAEVEAAWNA